MYGIDYSQIKKGDVVYIVSNDRRFGSHYTAKVTSVGKNI